MKNASVGEAIQDEIKRVRDEVLPAYDSLPKGAGTFAAMMLRQVLDRAAKALAEGDVVAIVRSYEELKGCA